MKLTEFRNFLKIGIPEAAAELHASAEAVRCWENGSRTPNQYWMGRIYMWSKGHVTPNDFYDLPKNSELTPGLEHEPKSSVDNASVNTNASSSSKAMLGGGVQECPLSGMRHRESIYAGASS